MKTSVVISIPSWFAVEIFSRRRTGNPDLEDNFFKTLFKNVALNDYLVIGDVWRHCAPTERLDPPKINTLSRTYSTIIVREKGLGLDRLLSLSDYCECLFIIAVKGCNRLKINRIINKYGAKLFDVDDEWLLNQGLIHENKDKHYSIIIPEEQRNQLYSLSLSHYLMPNRKLLAKFIVGYIHKNEYQIVFIISKEFEMTREIAELAKANCYWITSDTCHNEIDTSDKKKPTIIHVPVDYDFLLNELEDAVILDLSCREHARFLLKRRPERVCFSLSIIDYYRDSTNQDYLNYSDYVGLADELGCENEIIYEVEGDSFVSRSNDIKTNKLSGHLIGIDTIEGRCILKVKSLTTIQKVFIHWSSAISILNSLANKDLRQEISIIAYTGGEYTRYKVYLQGKYQSWSLEYTKESRWAFYEKLFENVSEILKNRI